MTGPSPASVDPARDPIRAPTRDPARLAADDVVVGRLRLRADAARRERALAALDRTAWPRLSGPGAGGGRWVVLRQLRVRTDLGRVARETAARTRVLLDGAVHAGHVGAADAPAVYFDDYDDLLALLCADLARGLAGARWYWRRLLPRLRLQGRANDAGDPASAVAIHALLAREPLRLGSVCARLSELHALARVWRLLDQAAARDLQLRLAHATGLELPAADGRLASPPPAWTDPLPAHQEQRWRPALTGLSTSDERARLAACVLLLEWRPSRLQAQTRAQAQAGPAAAIDAVTLALTASPATAPRDQESEPVSTHEALTTAAPPPSPRGAEPLSTMGSDPALEPLSHHRLGDRPGTPGNPRPPAARPHPLLRVRELPHADQPPTGAALAVTPAAAPTETGTEIRAEPGAETRSKTTSAAEARSEPRPSSPSADAEPGGPPVDEAGLFYLINFLNRPEVAPLLAASGTPEDGWLRLWWLGRALALSADGTAARFLAERIGVADPVDLLELPPWPAVPPLMDLARRLYPVDAVWQPALLQVPGRLLHTPTHLDLHWPLAAVRLPVRLAALDIDPGWVPWLGRVVTFHYDEPAPV
ncbi:MAG: hypothetical protein LJE69_16690 [Thiohalocapsa sp.]|uniref:hypothetical protein n=1 Tax=Thiohalocapsa sp. TaxID=2497641 RepID=UPI0025FCDCEA|nr:hypothetical protein [Thiohalocapsa sp.]MCG6942875.1 hypothetical protein [Thiohalocapsa sp.]